VNLSASKRELFVEFKEGSMHVLDGERGIDIPFERQPDGRISTASIDQAASHLRAFFESNHAQWGRIATCSIPARGVSLRRMSVPSAERDETRRLLALQLEAQLPVSPKELAWGCAPLAREKSRANGAPSLQEFLVVAVRRDFLGDYTRILASAGVAAEYTIGALARQGLVTGAPSEFSVLETGRVRSELASFDMRGPAALRVISWGTEMSSGAIDGTLRNSLGQKLYVTGATQSLQPLASAVSIPIEFVDGVAGTGRTPANLGLKQLIETGVEPVLLTGYEPAESRPVSLKWKFVILTGLLAFLALSFRYAESIFYRARLSNKLAAILAYRNTLPKIEREFSLLNYIKTNQPPYIDTITLLALGAPPGTRIETLSVVRRGDLSLRGTTGDAQAPGAFRAKLIESGFFSRVVLEEQAPSPDGQKVSFRISAQIKSDLARKPFSLPSEPKSSGTNTPPSAAAGPPKK